MIEISKETTDRINAMLFEMPKAADKVMRRAVNRGLKAVKAQAYKGVMAEYAIKRKVIKEHTSDQVIKASSGDICGTVFFSGVQIPLYKYNLTTPKVPTPGALVKAGQKYQTPFEHAFIAEMKNPENNHIGIFKRSSKSSLPIKEVMGSSMRSMVTNAVVLDSIYSRGQEVLEKRIEHELGRFLEGYH